MKSSKIEEQLKRTEVRLQKTKEEKKVLQAKIKLLAEQAENERLCSRGKILESFLKEPLKLTDGDISYLLEIMFRSSFSQKKLQELIEAKERSASAPFGESDGVAILEDSHDQ